MYRRVPDVAGTVVHGFRSILQNSDRDKGEYEFSVGTHDQKLFSSSQFFTPSTKKVNGYEVHPSLGSAEVRGHGDTPIALIHSHPNEKDADPWHFSTTDKDQADVLQGQHPETPVRAFLLTPAPKNQILVYDPNDKAHPNGEEVGHFEPNGTFTISNEKYRKEFEKYKVAQ
jgi:hypothetical protein